MLSLHAHTHDMDKQKEKNTQTWEGIKESLTTKSLSLLLTKNQGSCRRQRHRESVNYTEILLATKWPICSKKWQAPSSKYTTFSCLKCFSSTDKHSSEVPSDLSHPSPCRLRQIALYFTLSFIRNKANKYVITEKNNDLSKPEWRLSNLWADDSSSDKWKLLSATPDWLPCTVIAHSGQQRVVKIYSVGSSSSHLHPYLDILLIKCHYFFLQM